MTSNGLLILDKPLGMSSRQALDRVSRRYRTRKAGFAGTLDPLASGVLVCALGVATRLLTYLEADAKRYVATVKLGEETDTDDAEGRAVAVGDWHAVGREQVESALSGFLGQIRQRPPAYSAISLGGQRLYARARRGEAVVAPEREVTVHRLALTAWQPPQFTVDVHCSKGTYIRALARDLGRTLGCYAYLAGLRRSLSGAFGLDRAVTMEQLDAAGEGQLAAYLLPPRAAIAHLPSVALDTDEVHRVRSGQRVRRADLADGVTVLLDDRGGVVAVGRAAGGDIQPEKVLPESEGR